MKSTNEIAKEFVFDKGLPSHWFNEVVAMLEKARAEGREEALEQAAKVCDSLTKELDAPSEKVFSEKFKTAIKKMTGSVVSEECAERIRALLNSK